jgi:hypothetical protein
MITMTVVIKSEPIRLTHFKQIGHYEMHWQWRRAWKKSMFIAAVTFHSEYYCKRVKMMTQVKSVRALQSIIVNKKLGNNRTNETLA